MAPLTHQELYDLFAAMMERMDAKLLPAIAQANREGTLDDLLAALGMGDLLAAPEKDEEFSTGKIIVLGASQAPVEKLRSIARKKGFDPSRFEFHLEYERLKHFDFGKIRGSMGYMAIFAGPMPHSTPGAAEAGSFVARVERNPQDYPLLIKLGKPGELKITNNSFKRALDELEAFMNEN